VLPDAGPAATQLALPLQRIALFLDDPAPRFSTVLTAPSRPSGQTFVLHIGSGSITKTWPLANWAEVLHHLSQTTPFPPRLILLSGEAEAERGLTQALADTTWTSLPIEHWHAPPLTELALRLQTLAAEGAFFLGHDSGIGHLAAAAGLPCLLLFGPTDPAVWAPQNPAVTVLQSPTEHLTDLPLATVLATLSDCLQP
jgi:ADP-heptose:LPS heptosyltransferase